MGDRVLGPAFLFVLFSWTGHALYCSCEGVGAACVFGLERVFFEERGVVGFARYAPCSAAQCVHRNLDSPLLPASSVSTIMGRNHASIPLSHHRLGNSKWRCRLSRLQSAYIHYAADVQNTPHNDCVRPCVLHACTICPYMYEPCCANDNSSLDYSGRKSFQDES